MEEKLEQEQKLRYQLALQGIVNRLIDIDVADLTTAERQIQRIAFQALED